MLGLADEAQKDVTFDLTRKDPRLKGKKEREVDEQVLPPRGRMLHLSWFKSVPAAS